MIFYGLNVAAFKLPISVPHREMLNECHALYDCFLPHNMQTGKTGWRTAAIKAALGNWRLTDPGFYRRLPEMDDVNGQTMKERREYMRQWAYTELASHCPKTTRFCQDIENLGSFMTGARFLQVTATHFINFHQDNNPHKEFRVTVGLEGMDDEEFVIQTGPDEFVNIPMKEGEAWFVDIGLGHAVRNSKDAPRYRLGLQYYSPTCDRMLKLFEEADPESVIYARHLQLGAPFA